MYNQLYYVENTIINTCLKGMLENKMNTTLNLLPCYWQAGFRVL
jgi:hypothetical protein